VDLANLVGRPALRPGEARLPWGDADFSARMLAEHLDDRHDLASRRPSIIDTHVDWLRSIVEGDGGRVLDLGCGPGLYLERLAGAGWECTGVDVSPAAIEHAERRAREAGLRCRYVVGDFRSAEVASDFDLVLCLFGELSTVPVDDVDRVLTDMAGRLRDGGRGVIELSTRAGVRSKGDRPDTWYTADGGLFADGAHLVMRESRWFEDVSASVERWWVVDESASPPRMIGSTTWWHGAHLGEAMRRAGLVIDGRFGDLTGAAPDDGDEFETIVFRLA